MADDEKPRKSLIGQIKSPVFWVLSIPVIVCCVIYVFVYVATTIYQYYYWDASPMNRYVHTWVSDDPVAEFTVTKMNTVGWVLVDGEKIHFKIGTRLRLVYCNSDEWDGETLSFRGTYYYTKNKIIFLTKEDTLFGGKYSRLVFTRKDDS